MPVPPNPSIKIAFDGLLVFTFDQTNQFCEIGVLKVQDHALRINRETKVSAGKVIHHPEINTEIESGDIGIEIPERNEYEGVSRLDAPKNSPQNFRWVVDIDELHNEFHPSGLRLKDGFPPRSIIVRQGLFYTVRKIPVSLIRPNGKRQEIKIASPVGCNIYMKQGETFVLSYGLAGKKLEIPAVAGETHKITIMNTPREHNSGNGHHPGNHSQTIHFRFFYDFAVDINQEEKFDIQQSATISTTIAGNPDRPCPVILMGRRTTGLAADAPVTQKG